MRFFTWFKMWISSFSYLLTLGLSKNKRESQREKERQRRLNAKYAGKNFYCKKKNRAKRRSSLAVQNGKILNGIFRFFSVSLAVLFLPFGMFDWGYKSIQLKKEKRATKSITAPRTVLHKKLATRKTVLHVERSLWREKDVVSVKQNDGDINEQCEPHCILEDNAYKLSVVKDGEKNISAVVQDETKPLGVLWEENINRFFADCDMQLQEGKLQIDAVKNLTIAKGRITADVDGLRSTPYKVIITIEPTEQTVRESDANIKHLFPTKKDFWLFCNCGNEICSHSIAVLYKAGNAFDENKENFYRLRGVKMQ